MAKQEGEKEGQDKEEEKVVAVAQVQANRGAAHKYATLATAASTKLTSTLRWNVRRRMHLPAQTARCHLPK